MTDVQGHQLTEQQEKSFIDTVALCVEILRDEDLTSRRQILLTEIMIMSIEALIGNRLGFPPELTLGHYEVISRRLFCGGASPVRTTT